MGFTGRLTRGGVRRVMKRLPRPGLHIIILAVLLALGILFYTASGFSRLRLLWVDFGMTTFFLFIPPVIYTRFTRLRQKKVSASVVSGIVLSTILFSILMYAGNATAFPDRFYLHDVATSGISPAGLEMNTVQGTGGATLTFDTVDQEAYWYTDTSFTSGLDAGDYTLNMYFDSVPNSLWDGGWWDANWTRRHRLVFDNTATSVTTVEVRVSASTDDAEEATSTGVMDLTSSDLELIREGGANNQEVGMRFPGLQVPKNATIVNAYIEFEVDETTTEQTDLNFYAQAADDPPTFTSTGYNISTRPKSSAVVYWDRVIGWPTLNQKERTPNLAAIIQETVNRPGWTAGNALVVVVTGSGQRIAEAYNGEAANAPLLHVEYAESLMDFPVLVKLDSSRVDYSQVQDQGQDLRFIDADGETVLSHEIETWNETGTSFVWVRVPRIDGGSESDHIWMYYGNTAASGIEDATGVWSSDHVAVWHLNQTPTGSASDIGDSTAGAHHGTSQGGMGSSNQVSAAIDGGLDFDDVNDYVNAGNSADFDLTTYSWSMWVRTDHSPTGGENEQPLWNGDTQFQFNWNHNNAAYRGAALHNDGAWQPAQIATSLQANVWYFVSATYDGTNLRVYLNGSLEDTQAAGTPVTSTYNFTMGNDPFNLAFAGQLDEVRVSSAARSASWTYAQYLSDADQFITFGATEARGYYTYRRQIDVTTGTTRIGTGYSVNLTVNHAALVSAGKAQADGDDLRVAYWNGSAWNEMHRVLDIESAWNGGSTEIWFRTVAPIAASTTDANYSLFYGNPSAANPPANPRDVFVFYDGFESGDMARWTAQIDGIWSVESDQANNGTYSLRASTAVNINKWITADGVNEANVLLDARWRISSTNSDIDQGFRARESSTIDTYSTNLEATAGWNIARWVSGTWTELSPNADSPTADTWTKITTVIIGQNMRVFKDDTQINPSSGWFDVGANHTSGSIGFHTWRVPAGSYWWIDDVILRQYVDPEPTTSLGAEISAAYVQITVSVYHTRADGTDPQEIVTSSAVTINSNTPSPYGLDIGAGTTVDFPESDPRILRLRINVTAVNDGGSFVLAYDSASQPTNLETPSFTALPQLSNPGLTPSSGSPTTFFNFTIDYSQPDGVPANMVRVNVSDATNNTYNNFTMLPASSPELDYFVGAYWALNGTVINFPNAQSSSDGGASALIVQGGASNIDMGTGADGSVTCSTTCNVNTDVLGTGRSTNADGITTNVTANPTGTSISVTSTTGIAAGDEILLINLRGSSGDTADVGNYEFLDVSSVSGGNTINLQSAVQKSYDGSNFANQAVVVQRVPQWTTVTIQNGGVLTANAWDGTTGGVIVFRATGTVTIQAGGSISANGLGYRGGTGGNSGGSPTGGQNGESFDGFNGAGGNSGQSGTQGGGAGTNNGVHSQGVRGGGGGGGAEATGDSTNAGGGGAGGGYGGGGGGGGGSGDGSSASGLGGSGGGTDVGGGGGGCAPGNDAGGNGGNAGQAGGSSGVGASSCTGGAAGSGGNTGESGNASANDADSGGAGGGGGGLYGNPALSKLYFGSGGGGGGGSNEASSGGGSGGSGGGIILIVANVITISGTLSSNGSAGVDGGPDTNPYGAGGGGSGGSILARSNSITNSGTFTATGGSGGARGGTGSAGSGGGGGGVGRIRIESDSISATTTPTASTAGLVAITFDAVSSNTGTTSPLTFSHTIGGGSNRLLVVGVGVEGTAGNWDVTAVTYNSVALTKAVDHNVGTATDQNTELWYMLDADLPSAGTYTVSISVSGTPGEINGGAISVTGAAQQGPEATATNDDGGTGASSIQTQITTATDGAWVFDAVGSGSAISFGPTSGQTEQFEETGTTSAVAGGTKEVGTAGATWMNWSATGSNRLSHSLAAFAPVASSGSSLLVQFNTTGIRSSGDDTLVIRYNLTSADDTFGVWVWNFTSGDWVNRGTLDQTFVSFLNYTLTSDEKSSGEVRIRFNDTSDGGSTDLSIDYQLVNNTLWTSGVTYYYNTTLAAGWYEHFFWANDTNGESNRTATFSGPTVLASPAVTNFRLENATAASRVGEQLDVDMEYYFIFNVTDANGWTDIGDNGNVSLRLWYDGNQTPELTYDQQTTGANYRIELKYVDTSDPSTAALNEWSVTEGRATYNESASSLTAITDGYEFKLALKLGFQVKQANDPTDSSPGEYNDNNSWNAEIVAYDGTEMATLQTASTGEHLEFGVYMYTFVNISANWAVTLGPGDTQSTNTVTVYYRSNDDFRMRVWFVTNLEDGSNTIDITNVQILAAADPNDNITSDLTFNGLGIGNAEYIFGSATWWFSHSTDSDEDTVDVQFSVTVPFGTTNGTYTAQLTIRIQQRSA